MKLSPSSISQKAISYSIPIYQRLFEWDIDNVQTLLEDLKKSFDCQQDDYYIGMLTSTHNNELVDGQQRFTVMILMGCVLQNYYDKWSKFLLNDQWEPRLHFVSRLSDESFLRMLINNEAVDENNIVNDKMYNGIKTVSSFMDGIKKETDKKSFAKYIFHHMCFFITELPENYNPRDLNKYFERMNTTGKNLEQHEILKVKLLSHLKTEAGTYMTLWNKLADVDTLLIRRKNEGEKEQKLKERKNRSFSINIKQIVAEGVINGIGKEEKEASISIVNIEPSEKAPTSEIEYVKDSHCALTFPYLLLQTLYYKIKMKGDIEGNISDFFKPNNLLETFQKYLPYEGKGVDKKEIASFMELLVKCRLALDICFVRPSEYGYSLDMICSEDDKSLKRLLMIESMLYVSSSNYTHYRWFGWLMDLVLKRKCIPSCDELFNTLKQSDDSLEEHKQVPLIGKLNYDEDIRYWFWRLDLYIWEHRETIFKDSKQALIVADNFVFRRNRSIEHIAPQTPKTNSNVKWDDPDRDRPIMNSWGNLVMISQGLNSALSNESYEVKTAHVQSFTNGSKTGSIESLKLLVVHQDYKMIVSVNRYQRSGRIGTTVAEQSVPA